jgi:hypothetical protein
MSHIKVHEKLQTYTLSESNFDYLIYDFVFTASPGSRLSLNNQKLGRRMLS